jgi:hypothetical protein
VNRSQSKTSETLISIYYADVVLHAERASVNNVLLLAMEWRFHYNRQKIAVQSTATMQVTKSGFNKRDYRASDVVQRLFEEYDKFLYIERHTDH